MNSDSIHATIKESLLLLGVSSLLFVGLANAQVPVDADGNPISTIESVNSEVGEFNSDEVFLSATELETLVGPVALYPDDLLAIVLPASTYPLEIVQAARFLQQLEDDPTLQPDDEWDESVIALLNYPEVINLMNDDLDWTWKLGEAVIAQQNDLVAAVETFRDRAYAAGNLKSDEYQTVSNDDGIIEIEPVSDDVIYVPYYEPERVVVYQAQPVYAYYPRPYPVYYYPYAAGHHFRSGFFWGVTTAFTIGWATNYLHVYHQSYYGHPYYGHTYYGNHYWRRPSLYRYNSYYVNNNYQRSHDYYRHGDYWRPRHHGGARPGHQVARNSYYGGSQRSNTRNYQYRDGRTDGLAYNGNVRSSRSTSGGSSRHVPGSRNVTARASAPRPSVKFRQRSTNSFVGSKVPRLERGASSSNAQVTRRSNTTRGTANATNRDTVRFRSRTSAASRAPTRTAAVRQPSRRTATRATSTPVRRVANSSDRTPRSSRNSAPRATSASTARVRQSAPARVSQPPRQAAERRPSRTSDGRSASPPAQSRQRAESRPSSRKGAPRQEKAATRSKRDSGAQRRSSRSTR